MSSMHDDDIAIVGYGAMLPEANNAGEFWANILSGHCSIRELPNAMWRKELYYSANGDDPDKTRSVYAAYVEQAALDNVARRLAAPRQIPNRLSLLTLAAAEQALAPLGLSRSQADHRAIFLGCMAPDEGHAWRKFIVHEWDSLQDYARCHLAPEDVSLVLQAVQTRLQTWNFDRDRDVPYLFPSAVLSLLRQRFPLHGEGALVDAACASSCAAIDLGLKALRNGDADLVLSGGIDASLVPHSFVIFSQLGALARERCLPFDRYSQGVSQGEGAVLFALERLGDAQRHGHPVHGIVKACGASSDGMSASLFAPTSAGQQRAYEQAYQQVDRATVDYVEGHATGTSIGDQTELKSIVGFFDNRKLPIGSVKALVGHTKGAAGAVSLLKCLLMLKHRTIPPSPYFRASILQQPHQPYVNTAPIGLRPNGPPLTFGISSFGFGGVNYHMVLQEMPANVAAAAKAQPCPSPANPPIVLVGHHIHATADVHTRATQRALRIPPHGLSQIDAVQLAALLATLDGARTLHIDFEHLDRHRVAVIAASTLGLDLSVSIGNRILHFELQGACEDLDAQVAPRLLAHKERHPPITEDSGPGSLNNVIAGRVANYFNLTGPSFNVDADLASFPAALRMAQLTLGERGGLVILLAVEEHYQQDAFNIERRGVSCWFVATLDFAKQHNLPIQASLEQVQHRHVAA